MKTIDWRYAGKRIGIAASVCIVMIMLMCGIVASLITNELLTIDTGKKAMVVVVLFLLFWSSWSAARQLPSKRLLISVLTAAMVLVVLILTKSIAFQEATVSPWSLLLPLLISVPAGLAASSKKRKKR